MWTEKEKIKEVAFKKILYTYHWQTDDHHHQDNQELIGHQVPVKFVMTGQRYEK